MVVMIEIDVDGAKRNLNDDATLLDRPLADCMTVAALPIRTYTEALEAGRREAWRLLARRLPGDLPESELRRWLDRYLAVDMNLFIARYPPGCSTRRRLVVAGPRVTELARIATSIWLRRPGTDGAHVIARDVSRARRDRARAVSLGMFPWPPTLIVSNPCGAR